MEMNPNNNTSGALTTALQYATIAAVGYGIYYTRQKSNARQAPEPARAAPETETRNEKSAKKQRVQQYAQDASSQKQAPAKTQPKASGPPKQETAEDDDDDELNNKEFAQQLASLKEGKKFTAKSGNEKKKKKQKSVKQSQAKAADPTPAKGTPPPNADDNNHADDDQSAPESPEVAAADAGGVSDMLEAPSPGAGSLRIVPSEFTQVQKSKKQKQAAEPALTKKQRQRRKKAEATRAEADEAETDRKALMEKQRRLARVSEGRAAKDGSQFMAANGKNAWKSGQPNGIAAEKPAAEAAAAPLLDTFEKPAPAPAAKKAPAPAQSEGWTKAVPSEEEQLERLKSETEADEWNTVTTKKSKKVATPTEEKTEAATFAKAPQASQPAQAKAAPVTNGKPAVASGYGAFSALTTEDPEEEEEVEWDV